MINKLQLLYALQQVDTSLDDLHELKGNLPAMVEDLEQSLKEKKKRLSELESSVKKSNSRRNTIDDDILNLKQRIEKYKKQQFEIKTNKQYDALTREIEYSKEQIVKLEKEMRDLDANISIMKSDVEPLAPEIKSQEKELADKKYELDFVNKEHEDEELKFKHQREKIVVRISKSDSSKYERIRKAKVGKAVVAVHRNSCDGCHHLIPPQLNLELRKNNRIINCEHCGRILVSDEVAEGAKNIL